MLNLKKIHCIGIGGIHVSALAKLLLKQGAEVSGSDLVKSEITDELQKMGACVYIGHDDAKLRKECLPEMLRIPKQAGETTKMRKGIDLVIYSDAVPDDNVERVEAKKLGIRQMSSYEFIGELSQDYWTIAVSGTNGKSTTTAMLGLILEAAGLDPTVIVGTKVKEWGGNIRIGKSKYLVTEADEYKAHMLKLHPKMIVLTNIEADHLDYYQDIDDIVAHFKKYVGKLTAEGVLVYNKDDERIVTLLHCYIVRKIAYTAFDVSSLKLQVPGGFNRYNAAGAMAAAKELGVSDEVIKKSLEDFKGTWRRFEQVGEVNGALVISDYAHHPTAVAGTIKAARELYSNRRLIVVFQPHQHNRTRMLFDDFAAAFAKASAAKLVDLIIISEIYDVAGRTSGEDKRTSSRDLVEKVKSQKSKVKSRSQKLKVESKVKNILYGRNLEETGSMIVHYIKPKDVVLIMGAGDIDGVARGLVK